MLPLSIKDDEYKPPKFNLFGKISGWFRSILSDKTSRNLFFFLCLNLSFAFVELLYGIWSNCLGLISDSFHMFFDSTAILAGLAASVISKWRDNDAFSYGYVRAEVLAGFVNGLFLIFTAFFIFSEGVERALAPPDVHHERLLLVSILGFVVNLVGIFVFNHGGHGHSHGSGHGHSHSLFNGALDHSHGHEDHCHSHGAKHGGAHSHDHDHAHGHGHLHSHDGPSFKETAGPSRQILQGVFLHILADTLGSIGVIASAIMMQNFGLMIADPICSILIAILIVVSVIPLLRESIGILMQRTPPSLENVLPQCYQRVQQLQGVYNLQEQHFWTLCSDVYVGTLKLVVAPDADARWILSQTHNIFTQEAPSTQVEPSVSSGVTANPPRPACVLFPSSHSDC
ncbi:solute carrier family 30 (zinc transporter), member 7 [Rattus norvegicus]|uniref:Zinc transporter n=1 Tax=Rattus norvegicus TaxID=10116 RepID=A6HV84_RAT|nr:solute carrier family 30 (zinc transporter), member 7 [Rattus norvegicus]